MNIIKTKLHLKIPAIDRSRIICAQVLLLSFICMCVVGKTGGLSSAKADSKPAVSPVLDDMIQHSTEKSDRDRLKMSLSQAMWAALAFEDIAQLKEILLDGANPNAPEEISLMTPLMVSDNAEIAELLLKAGADPNSRDKLGRTVTHHAIQMSEAASVVRLLGKAGADIDVRAEQIGGMTPLFCAVDYYIEGQAREETALAIRILVHLGADANVVDAAGRSPLALAAANNQPELIRLLIELGADPSQATENGKTPLDFARESDAHDAIKELASTQSGQTKSN